MNTDIPSVADVVSALRGLSMAQVERLHLFSGVPASTLIKIKFGQTGNPGLDTVNDFWPFIERAASDAPAPRKPPMRLSKLAQKSRA